MAGFLVDEDLPTALAPELRKAGFHADDVRQVGLRGHSDNEIRAYAVKHGLTVLTADVEFGNAARYPAPSAGTVVVRLPTEISAPNRIRRIIESLNGLTIQDFAYSIAVIESNDVRIRKAQ